VKKSCRRIKIVAQEDTTGCGIACVASVANLRYKEVKDAAGELFRWTKLRETFYLKVNEIGKLLFHLEIAAEKQRFRDWAGICGVSIVGVKIPKSDSGYHHWIVSAVKDNRLLVMDPRYGEIYDGKEKKNAKLVQGRRNSILFQVASRFSGNLNI